MSEQLPRVPANLEQQHKLAKDLLRDAKTGDRAALARVTSVRADAGVARPLQLADAQLAIAREAGFDSWPMLVEHLAIAEGSLEVQATLRKHGARE